MKSLLFNTASISVMGLALTATAAYGDTTPKQKFACNTGYSMPDCVRQVSTLREALNPYHPERLGEWTWVLVKSADWKGILLSRGLNPDSPAFTVLEKRQTFLEEALFVQVPNRSAELLRFWSVPLDKMLDLAITHELGHAACSMQDEHLADSFGRQLREGRNPECVATPNELAKSH
jgi:hypothetical protein